MELSTATQFPSDRVWTPGEIGDAIGDDECWRRYEIVDGVLVVSPPPTPLHDLLAVRLVGALSSAVLDGFVATTGVGLDLGRSYRITDATVVASDYIARGDLATPSDVLLAIEIESPSSITTDRITKPAQYAAAGIAHYWRVELDPLRLHTYRLTGDSYEASGSWDAADTAALTDPFEVTLDLATLLP